jgi:SAM-dependent MidA family methyltransferase
VVANEVLDCLPTRQWERREGAWRERRIGLAGDQLVFGLAPAPGLEGAPEMAPEGAVFEHSPAQEALASELGARIASEGGAALLVDYGREAPGLGDTLQAVSGHRKVDPLERPGQVDLTVHADFPSVLAAARREGVETRGPMAQGDFLRALGLEARARALSLAQPESGERIRRQVERLAGAGQMGDLFLAVALHSPGLRPPGFGTQT